jgi:predicted dehydrogenase
MIRTQNGASQQAFDSSTAAQPIKRYLALMKGLLTICLLSISFSLSAQTAKPFRIAIDGLTHTHVHWLLGRAKDGDIEIVGIAEKNRELAERYLKQYKLPMSLLYPTLADLLKRITPDGVAAFNSIYEHLSTVQQCAPKGISVMVEKPLAVFYGSCPANAGISAKA